MVLKYHISPYPALLEDMVVKIWEAQSDGPGAEVYTQTLSQPHSSPVTITVNGLDKVVHIVRLYSAVSVALLHEYNSEATSDSVTVFDPIYFKIGDGGPDTPVAGTDTYVNSVLIGLGDNDFQVFRNNYGYLFPGVHYTNNPLDGGFTLGTGDVFNGDPEGEEFLIQRKSSSSSTIVNDSVVGKWFAGFVDIAANTDYTSSHLRKLIRFSGTCAYTFPVSGAIPIGYGFVFEHYGSTLGTGTVNFSNAPLKWGTTTKTSIDIPSYCEACFVFDGTNWNVVYLNQSTWVNSTGTYLAGQTIAVGQLLIPQQGNASGAGDVPSGDPVYTITHNMAITGDYVVMLSLKTNTSGSFGLNNSMFEPTWRHHDTDKPNKFLVSLQEFFAQTQNINIVWLIIKI